MSKLFDKILQEIPDDTNRFVARSMDVSDQITEILKRKGTSQRQLAEKLGKSESEISKWLSGNHNFTLRTLAKIESILEEDILITPMYWNEYKGLFAPVENDYQVHFSIHKGHISHRFSSGEEKSNFDFEDIMPNKIKGKSRILHTSKSSPRIISELWKQAE